MEPKSSNNWGQMEQEYLNKFYNTQSIVRMTKLTNTKPWKDEPVLDYIIIGTCFFWIVKSGQSKLMLWKCAPKMW